MTEVRFHSSDPSRPVRTTRLGPVTGPLAAAGLLIAGLLVGLGLLGAPDLIADIGRSADVLALRDIKLLGLQAFASVNRRQERLATRVAADELFLARVATVAEAALPDQFPGDPPAHAAGAEPSETEAAVGRVSRRMFRLEAFRRRLASSTASLDADMLPSVAPLEPNAAVPVALFGPRPSPLSGSKETFPGLLLAAPAGITVIAPAVGVVSYAGRVPTHLGASWRRLGTVLAIAHGDRHYTVYGHLETLLVKRGQEVRRGQPLGRVGQSGFATRPQLHYEVRRVIEGIALPLDPRLFVLDADWITAREVREAAPATKAGDLPDLLK